MSNKPVPTGSWDAEGARIGPDAVVARIAGRQHGVITAAQMGAAGLSRYQVHHRVRKGRIHRIHRGVYSVGHPSLINEGKWMAAVLACGAEAVLSHFTAAYLWGFLSPRSVYPHVTVPRDGGCARRAGIQVHRSSILTAAQTTFRKNIPVTTPVRTIADLRRVAAPRLVRRAIREAELQGFRVDQEKRVRTRSELEDRFLALCRRHRLPMPKVNAQIENLVVDFVWPEQRLVVETDGYRFHRGRQAFDGDRARDVRLKLLGFDVLRFSDRQLEGDPGAVASALRALLGAEAA